MHVIPNGIDVENFDLRGVQARPTRCLPPGAVALPRVAMVGSMHLPDKGHADLLEAAAIAQGARRPGAVSPRLRRRPAPGARGAGARARPHRRRRTSSGAATTCRACWCARDIVVHPSWSEGFPNAVLEAHVRGAPRRGHARRRHPRGHARRRARPARRARASGRAGRRRSRSCWRNPLAAHVMGLRGRQHVEQPVLARPDVPAHASRSTTSCCRAVGR